MDRRQVPLPMQCNINMCNIRLHTNLNRIHRCIKIQYHIISLANIRKASIRRVNILRGNVRRANVLRGKIHPLITLIQKKYVNIKSRKSSMTQRWSKGLQRKQCIWDRMGTVEGKYPISPCT
jgi:hypothetical protein